MENKEKTRKTTFKKRWIKEKKVGKLRLEEREKQHGKIEWS